MFTQAWYSWMHPYHTSLDVTLLAVVGLWLGIGDPWRAAMDAAKSEESDNARHDK